MNKKIHARLAVVVIAILLSATSVLAASGWLDLTFGTNGIATADLGSDSDSGRGVVLQPDGKILLMGFIQLHPDNPYASRTMIISRYNSDGTVDNSFGLDGRIYPETDTFYASEIAVQADGKLLVAGLYGGDFAVVRYNDDGTLDTSFGDNGTGVYVSWCSECRQTLSDVAIQPDGKIVFIGDTTVAQSNYDDIVFARLNSDGTRDVGDIIYFPNYRYSWGKSVAIQPDGKIVISGEMIDQDGKKLFSLARLNQDGSLDASTFGKKGTVTIPLSGFQNSYGAIALQKDGKIVMTGRVFNDADENLAVVRFNKKGALDTTFNKTGIVITDFGAQEYGADVHLQADGKIIVVGTSSTPDSDNLLIVRYNKNGSLDKTFGDNGKLIGNFGDGSSSGAGIEIQPDGKAVVAGSSNGDAILARYILSTTVTTTFKSVGAYDGWILESVENSDVGGAFNKTATTFNIGDDFKNRQYKGILSFNTSKLPDAAVITSVQLRIKKQGSVGTDPFTTHGDLLVDIRDSAFSNSIILQAGDFSAAASESAKQELIPPATVNNWYTVNLDSSNLELISKIGVTQLRLSFSLDDNDDLVDDYLKFFSGNSASANMPQLIITYYVP